MMVYAKKKGEKRKIEKQKKNVGLTMRNKRERRNVFGRVVQTLGRFYIWLMS